MAFSNCKSSAPAASSSASSSSSSASSSSSGSSSMPPQAAWRPGCSPLQLRLQHRNSSNSRVAPTAASSSTSALHEQTLDALHSSPPAQTSGRSAGRGAVAGAGEGRGGDEAQEDQPLCFEISNGRCHMYFARGESGRRKGGHGHRKGLVNRNSSKSLSSSRSRSRSEADFEVVEVVTDRSRRLVQSMKAWCCSWILPDGYPATVSPDFAPYMRWRAVQYLFGGALSVFTTRALLSAVGAPNRGHAPAAAAVAVNWAIKDGAGRLGKMLFARQGKKFDCELKQFRFAGNVLMMGGASVELATAFFPRYFLPLACCANLAKNLAAVTASSTRAPIYKAFARSENLGDITAKGESVSNLADLVGTGIGICLSRRHSSALWATYGTLAAGYIFGSYREVRSVQIPTLNRSRLEVVANRYLEDGEVMPPKDANKSEALCVFPWARHRPMELGARVSEAFPTAEAFKMAAQTFRDESYLVTYRLDKRKVFVVLKDNASPEDILRAAFQATEVQDAIVAGHVDTRLRFPAFLKAATTQGWRTTEDTVRLLNPKDARLCQT
eukprot:jgi/Chlat1/2837/Chrsp191S02996